MEDFDNKAVADRLRYLAQLVGGPSAFSRLTGLSRTTTHDYLSELRPIRLVRLHLIAARYPCSLEWLLQGVGDPPVADPKRTLEANRSTKRNPGESLQYRSQSGKVLDLRTIETLLDGVTGLGPEVRYQSVEDRVLELIEKADPERMEKILSVLGPELLQLIVEGRAIPSRRLAMQLAITVGERPGWILGLGR